MTRNDFYAMLAAILLFMALILFYPTLSRAESEWKKEVGITEWCGSLETIETFIDLRVRTDMMAWVFIRKKIQNGQCAKAPPGIVAAFSPQEIVKRYPRLGAAKVGVVVVQGRLIKPNHTLGEKAYVITLTSRLWRFHITKEPRKAPRKVPGKAQSVEKVFLQAV